MVSLLPPAGLDSSMLLACEISQRLTLATASPTYTLHLDALDKSHCLRSDVSVVKLADNHSLCLAEDTEMSSEHKSPQEPTQPADQIAPAVPAGSEMFGNAKVLNFKDLAGGEKMVYIRMGDQYYRLTLTRGGRLVLTK
jgi:hemin uptake protein HemP